MIIITGPNTGGKTVALQANGTPGTTTQSNTNTKTNYITNMDHFCTYFSYIHRLQCN